MSAATSIESFFVTLLERLFAMIWNEFQVWIAQPGNFDRALGYIDDILSSAGIAVQPSPSSAPPGQSVTPAPTAATAGTPAAVQSVPTPAAAPRSSVESVAAPQQPSFVNRAERLAWEALHLNKRA